MGFFSSSLREKAAIDDGSHFIYYKPKKLQKSLAQWKPALVCLWRPGGAWNQEAF